MTRILIVLCLAACGGKQTSSGRSSTDDTKPATGKVGEVCHRGEHHSDDEQVNVVTCAPGLNCCYLCGIPGCDSSCYAGDCPTDIP